MKYGTTLVTAPTLEPVTLDEAKKQVEVSGGDHDPHLTRLVKTARQTVEQMLNRQLITATWDLKLDRFPCGFYEPIYVPKPPLVSATITYYDAAGTLTTLPTSVYKVVTSREPGEIHLKFGQAWPVAYQEAESVTVRFVAGYGATTLSVPEGIRQAILLLVDDYFENRTGEGEMGPAVHNLLAAYSVGDEFHAYAL